MFAGLTADQIYKIEEIIRMHHWAFIANTVGREYVPEEIFANLVSRGLINKSSKALLKKVVQFGDIVEEVGRTQAVKLSYAQFKALLRKMPEITELQKMAVAYLSKQAVSSIRKMSRKVEDGLAEAATKAARRERTVEIANATEGYITSAKKVSARMLANDLANEFGGYAKDFRRTAVTEVHNAVQQGVASTMRSKYGNDIDVIKLPAPDACFPAGVCVYTKTGVVPIEDIKTGDVVLTHKLRWRKVVGVSKREYCGGITTIQSGGRSVTATSNHPFLSGMNWVEAKSVKYGDEVVTLTGILDTDEYPSPITEKPFFFDIPLSGCPGVVPASPIHLYRDLLGRDSDIEVVDIEGKFGNKFLGKVGRQVRNQILGIIRHVRSTVHFCTGFFTKGLGRDGLSSSLSCILSKTFPLFFCHARHACGLSGTGVFQGHPFGFKPCPNGVVGDPVFSSKRTKRCRSRRVFFSNLFHRESLLQGRHGVSSTKRVLRSVNCRTHKVKSSVSGSFEGVVYNLCVEEDESYFANGIAVHNCPYCKLLFLDDNGEPKVFKLSKIEGNSNIGRKAGKPEPGKTQWLPTVDAVHPHCRCQLIRIPKGWEWDSSIGTIRPKKKART